MTFVYQVLRNNFLWLYLKLFTAIFCSCFEDDLNESAMQDCWKQRFWPESKSVTMLELKNLAHYFSNYRILLSWHINGQSMKKTKNKKIPKSNLCGKYWIKQS